MPQKLTISNDAMVWSGTYDAFGNYQEPELDIGGIDNPLRFPGQYVDEETGLYYNLNRYYDPKIGRYLQTDPAGDGLNPYAYVGGNPVNAIDPNGLCALRMVGGIADIGVGLLLTAKTGGLGLVVAWGIIINGADNLVAGAYSMIAGEEIPSLIQGGFRRAIPNRTAADLAYMGFEIGLNVAGLAVERAAQRAAAQVAREGPLALPESSVWDFGLGPRGRYIEESLGHNLPSNFPTIDKFDEVGDVITSIKSMNLRDSSYRTAKGIMSTGRRYIRKLVAFKGRRWADVTVDVTANTRRVLELAIPPGATAAQQAALEGLVDYGNQLGVEVIIQTLF